MVDVILPCLNEAAALPWVLSRLPDGYRAIVADNGSTDGSAEVAGLPTLRDVDTVHDAHAVAALAPANRFASTLDAL